MNNTQAQFNAIGKMSQTTPQAILPQYRAPAPGQTMPPPKSKPTQGGTAQYYQEKQALNKVNQNKGTVYNNR